MNGANSHKENQEFCVSRVEYIKKKKKKVTPSYFLRKETNSQNRALRFLPKVILNSKCQIV